MYTDGKTKTIEIDIDLVFDIALVLFEIENKKIDSSLISVSY